MGEFEKGFVEGLTSLFEDKYKEAYNKGIQDAVDAIKLMSGDYVEDGFIGPDKDGDYLIPHYDQELGKYSLYVSINREEILNLKIK